MHYILFSALTVPVSLKELNNTGKKFHFWWQFSKNHSHWPESSKLFPNGDFFNNDKWHSLNFLQHIRQFFLMIILLKYCME